MTLPSHVGMGPIRFAALALRVVSAGVSDLDPTHTGMP